MKQKGLLLRLWDSYPMDVLFDSWLFRLLQRRRRRVWAVRRKLGLRPGDPPLADTEVRHFRKRIRKATGRRWQI